MRDLSVNLARTVSPADTAITEAQNALQRGDHVTAIHAARRALSYDEKKLQAWWIWGLAAIETWAYGEAETALAEGAKRIPVGHPLLPRFMTQRARALVPLGRNAEACAMVQEVLTLGVEDADSLYLLGTVLANSLRETEALPLLRRATALSPNVAAYWHSQGDAEQFTGLIDEAQHSYEQAIACNGHWPAHLALARLKRWTHAHNHIERLKATPTRNLTEVALQGYALFKEYDDLGDRTSAWEWLQKGAASAHTEPATPRNPAWNAEDEAQVVAAWKHHFPRERFMRKSEPRKTTPRRIFIVGLPRSGTTLVERILTAHSAVQGLGELQTFPAATKLVSGAHGWALLDADTIATASQTDPQAFAQFYERETAYLTDGSSVVTDKLPHNSSYVGLIRLAFPDAAIVHVSRAPMDALFGAYKLHFAARWSFDFDDLAEHFVHHADLMAHWKACLGDDLIDISLEALIADPEVQIRQLLEACGLPFEAACLSPHEVKGVVSTASAVQVRRPINTDGIGAWKHYEAGLEPLRKNLMARGYL